MRKPHRKPAATTPAAKAEPPNPATAPERKPDARELLDKIARTLAFQRLDTDDGGDLSPPRRLSGAVYHWPAGSAF